jgi:hypothetical protein
MEHSDRNDNDSETSTSNPTFDMEDTVRGHTSMSAIMSKTIDAKTAVHTANGDHVDEFVANQCIGILLVRKEISMSTESTEATVIIGAELLLNDHFEREIVEKSLPEAEWVMFTNCLGDIYSRGSNTFITCLSE